MAGGGGDRILGLRVYGCSRDCCAYCALSDRGGVASMAGLCEGPVIGGTPKGRPGSWTYITLSALVRLPKVL
jgi:hypothetical protein